MAEEDKTYCGQGDQSTIELLKVKLGVSTQDVLDAMEQVGPDPQKLETFFRSKENSY